MLSYLGFFYSFLSCDWLTVHSFDDVCKILHSCAVVCKGNQIINLCFVVSYGQCLILHWKSVSLLFRMACQPHLIKSRHLFNTFQSYVILSLAKTRFRNIFLYSLQSMNAKIWIMVYDFKSGSQSINFAPTWVKLSSILLCTGASIFHLGNS